MYMLVMVLDETAHLNEILSAWQDAGIRGITILESTGLHRVLRRDSAQPMFAGFSQIFGSGRVGHNTLFAVIDDLALAEAAVTATEAIVGKLSQPNTGIVFVLPVVKTWGYPEPNSE